VLALVAELGLGDIDDAFRVTTLGASRIVAAMRERD
jgi:hypothetical protein